MIAAIVLCAVFAATAVLPTAAGAKQPSSSWSLYSYNSQATNLSSSAATPLAGGGASFPFPTKGWSALLVTNQYAGDLTGQTLSASIAASVTSGAQIQYLGQPDDCGSPATARLYIGTQPYSPFIVTSSNETDFWWSHAGVATLSNLLSGGQTISDTLANPGDWSDANGHSASLSQYDAAFANAIQHIQYVGLSLGGGCFFDNGVQIVRGTGSGSFQVNQFTP